MTYRGGRGYTLVEVLIFIALTSFLLVIAVSNLNRSQSETKFAQSVRDFESSMNDILNDAPSGYFPSAENLNCQVTGPGSPILSPDPTAQLGANEDCVYVGKAIQFEPDGQPDGTFLVYSMVGRREANGTGQFVTSIAEAQPVVVEAPVGTNRLTNGLRVSRIFNEGTPGTTYGSLAIMTNLSGATLSDSGASAQSVQIGAVADTSLGQITGAAITEINEISIPSEYAVESNGTVLCLENEDGRTASLTVGISGSSGSFLQIDDRNGDC